MVELCLYDGHLADVGFPQSSRPGTRPAAKSVQTLYERLIVCRQFFALQWQGVVSSFLEKW
jgi:hypothetical protein